MQHHKANVIAVMGGTGTGKSESVKQALRSNKPSRLIVWDTLEEYGEFAPQLRDHNQLIDTLSKAGKSKPFAVAFIGDDENRKRRDQQFSLVCGLARAAGNLTLIVDELKFVTSPQYAPERWSAATMKGRHAGLTIIGISQRPAGIDKDFLANCTQIRAFRLGYDDDRAAVARAMNEPVTRLLNLPEFGYIQKNMVTGEVYEHFGTVQPVSKRAAKPVSRPL